MTTNALAVKPNTIDEIHQIGQMLALSGYFDAKGNSDTAIAQVCTKILAGAEMGYGPFASVQGIHIIQGRPAVSANLMAAAVKSHPLYDYRVKRMDDKECSIEFFQRNGDKWESLGVSTFTADDARKAGTKNMDKFARNMLFARAMSNGVRWYVPDCFSGSAVYTPDELGASVDGNGDYIEVDYRAVDQATGEIKPPAAPTPTNGNGNAPKPAAPPLEVPPEVRFWEKPEDAYEWAVGIGASDNTFAARNAMKTIVEAHGGRFTKDNAMSIYTAYYHERMARAQEKAKAQIDNLDMATVAEVDPEGVFA
jgi:hypothetical protein